MKRKNSPDFYTFLISHENNKMSEKMTKMENKCSTRKAEKAFHFPRSQMHVFPSYHRSPTVGSSFPFISHPGTRGPARPGCDSGAVVEQPLRSSSTSVVSCTFSVLFNPLPNVPSHVYPYPSNPITLPMNACPVPPTTPQNHRSACRLSRIQHVCTSMYAALPSDHASAEPMPPLSEPSMGAGVTVFCRLISGAQHRGPCMVVFRDFVDWISNEQISHSIAKLIVSVLREFLIGALTEGLWYIMCRKSPNPAAMMQCARAACRSDIDKHMASAYIRSSR
jgi:hypothetical protein